MSSMLSVILISIAISITAYVCFAIFSVATFGGATKGTALNIYVKMFNNAGGYLLTPAYIGGYLYVVLLLVSYPLQTLPLKLSLIAVFPAIEPYNAVTSISIVLITVLLIIAIQNVRFVSQHSPC